MLARIAACILAAAMFSAPALAENDPLSNAYRSMIEAGRTLGQSAGSDPDAGALLDDLAAFEASARAAGAAMNAHGGPMDLGCIYRGMAADAALQAQRIAAGDVESAVETILLLAEDAVLVTPEQAEEVEDPYADMAGAGPACPMADLAASDAPQILALNAD